MKEKGHLKKVIEMNQMLLASLATFDYFLRIIGEKM